MIKEQPILMNSAMVRALLDGSKIQTRRIMKPQPEPVPHRPGDYQWPCNAFQSMVSVSDTRAPGAHGMAGDACPYGAHGDRLRVRETFFAYGRWETRSSAKKARDERHFVDMTVGCDRVYQFAADDPDLPMAEGRGGALPGWYMRPAIFMPRAASRILLEIVSVRVEQLTDCSEADALAEGVAIDRSGCHFIDGANGRHMSPVGASAVEAFASLWESINGTGSWALNPWVWVIEFKRGAP